MKPVSGSTLAILLAAGEMPGTFTAEELIVSAWKRDTKTFGLKGYTDQFPDSNKVLAALMGTKGLVARGWLKKEGPKLYSATTQTKAYVAKLPTTTRLSKDQEKAFENYCTSDVVLHDMTLRGDLSLAYALQFWGIGQNDAKVIIEAKLQKPGQILNILEDLLQKQTDVILSSGMSVSIRDVKKVRKAHEVLQERYRRHLNLLIDRNK